MTQLLDKFRLNEMYLSILNKRIFFKFLKQKKSKADKNEVF